MKYTLVTLFPEWFDSPLSAGLMARAREAGLVDFFFANPRDMTTDPHHTVDDRPYGGGPGMVLMLEPLVALLRSLPPERRGRMLALTPGGCPFTQNMARELAREPALTLICGRYEGFDARLFDILPIEPVCVGDAVLNGGEAAALAVIEATARLQPGFMGKDASGDEESFSNGLLEYPQYTRPEIWHNRAVPAVLLTGAHDAVAKWQEETAIEVTRRKRPDMLYDHRVNGEPYARYIRVFVPYKEREYDIVAFMKMIFHRRILTNREQKILKRMMPVLDSLPTPPECEENSRIWLNAKNAGRILDMYAPLFDMLREHGIDYRIEYSDTPDGKPVAENENFTVFA